MATVRAPKITRDKDGWWLHTPDGKSYYQHSEQFAVIAARNWILEQNCATRDSNEERD